MNIYEFKMQDTEIWHHICSNAVAVFYYAADGSDARAPPGAITIATLELLNSVAGPAILYGREVVICTHERLELPYADFVHVVTV